MAKTFEDIRVLLVQARASEDMEIQEQSCFLERSRLHHSQLMARNVTRHRITADWLDEVDAFMIGGAGEFSATKEYVWTDEMVELIRAAADRDVPTFGSCWGHQMLARSLGGRVVHDHARAEMGCHPVRLTGAGSEDELFRGFPDEFMANMGHHDRVVELPPDAIEIAENDSQPYQAFRIKDKPIYGTQFHSELDAHRERERLIRYRSFYVRELASEEAFQRILESLADTTEVDDLLFEFLNRFVLKQASRAT